MYFTPGGSLALLGLVSLSIVLVSIDRFPNAWRFYARPYRKTDSHFRSALQNKIELPITNTEDGLNAAERALKKSGWPVERIADRNEPSLYSERHRFSVMAVYIVHASLLLIFAGGIIDGVFGYNGFMALQKGQTSNVIELRTGGTKQLPFSVKCNGAGQENYADGSPKRWWSKLAVVEDGQRNRSERDRGERSPGASGTALLSGQLRRHGQARRVKGRGHARQCGLRARSRWP